MATKQTETAEYVCTLSDDLVKKAEEELNEKAQWRSRDVQALRDMVKKKKELHIRTDDAFLLRFLRAKKFDYDRAMALIVKHFEMKADEKNKQLFTNLRPSSVKHVLEAGVTGVLPHRDKLGRRVIIFRPGRWDPSKFPIDDIFKTNFITLSKLIEDDMTQVTGVTVLVDLDNIGWTHATNVSPFHAKQITSLLQDEVNQINGVIMVLDLAKIGWAHAKKMSPLYAKRVTSLLQEEETQVNGVIMLNDLKNIGWAQAKNISPFFAKRMVSLLQEEETQVNGVIMVNALKDIGWTQAKNLSPFYAKRIASLLQDCFPMRFKGMHYVNEPTIFDYIFAIIRPFMKEKILSRIHFHSNRYEELAEFIDPEHLPEEYGGKQGPFSNADWAKKILACDAQFDEDAKYGLIKSTGVAETSTKDVALDCMAGSYRKLDI